MAAESRSWFRAKHVVFAFIAVMMGYVLAHNERFLIDPAHPSWPHYMTMGRWLLPHGLAGAAALFVAPFQFSDRLRKGYPRVHRVSGRIYVAGIVVLAPLGVYLQYLDESVGLPRSFTMAAVVDATLLYITTGIAFMYAVKRRITQHRQWMTRSYAVALVFFETRFILGVTGWETLGVAVTETVVWVCLAFAVLLGDIASQWQELVPVMSAPAKARAPLEDQAPARP